MTEVPHQRLRKELREVFRADHGRPKPWMFDRTKEPGEAMVDALLAGPEMGTLLMDQLILRTVVTQLQIPVPRDPHHPIIVARSHRHDTGPHWGLADRTDLARAHFYTLDGMWRDIRYLRHDQAYCWCLDKAIVMSAALADAGDLSNRSEPV